MSCRTTLNVSLINLLTYVACVVFHSAIAVGHERFREAFGALLAALFDYL